MISKDYLMDHVIDVECGDGTYQEAVLLEDIYDAPTVEYDEKKATDQMWSVMRLKEENTDLKIKLVRYEQMIDTQQSMLKLYNTIFMSQEAEITKLKEGKHNETN